MVQKTRKGGRYIGQGSYGCVFEPALKCMGEKTRRANSISKLMYKKNADEEYQQKNLLESLNSQQKYFIYPCAMCAPSLPFSSNNHVDKCFLSRDRKNPENLKNEDKLINQPNEMRLLQATAGGVNLLEVNLHRSMIYPLFKSFNNLFEGLIKLHKAGITHNDVKPMNIVTKEKHGAWTTRLIDFGQAFKTNTYPEIAEKYSFESNYPWWGPEMRFTNIDHVIQPEVDVDEWNKMAAESNIPPTILYKSVIINVPFLESLRRNLSAMPTGLRNRFIFTKSEVFSMGITLLEMFLKVRDYLQSKRFDTIMDQPMGSFLERILNADPFQRLSMHGAADLYKQSILPSLKRAMA
jgi:serine/threonine protein kinase